MEAHQKYEAELIPKRHRLLVVGWIKFNSATLIPDDIIKLVQLFSNIAINWTIEGEKFEKMFQRFNDAPNNVSFDVWKYSNHSTFTILPISIMYGGFQITVSVKAWNTGVQRIRIPRNHAWKFWVVADKKMVAQNLLQMEARLRITTNITPNRFYEIDWIWSDSTSRDRLEILRVDATSDIIGEYEKFNLLIGIERFELKYHKMNIKESLNWKLSKAELKDLRKEHTFIQQRTDNWNVWCQDYHNKFMKQLKVKPVSWPSAAVPSVNELTVEYKILWKGDGREVYSDKSTATVNSWNYGGFVVPLSLSHIADCDDVEIILDIEIVDILCVDGECKRESWREYGYV